MFRFQRTFCENDVGVADPPVIEGHGEAEKLEDAVGEDGDEG
jgi:hypothetical protein